MGYGERMECNPDNLLGMPVIKGAGIPVELILRKPAGAGIRFRVFKISKIRKHFHRDEQRWIPCEEISQPQYQHRIDIKRGFVV